MSILDDSRNEIAANVLLDHTILPLAFCGFDSCKQKKSMSTIRVFFGLPHRKNTEDPKSKFYASLSLKQYLENNRFFFLVFFFRFFSFFLLVVLLRQSGPSQTLQQQTLNSAISFIAVASSLHLFHSTTWTFPKLQHKTTHEKQQSYHLSSNAFGILCGCIRT